MALTFDLDFDHGRRSTYSECPCVTPLPLIALVEVSQPFFTSPCTILQGGWLVNVQWLTIIILSADTVFFSGIKLNVEIDVSCIKV